MTERKKPGRPRGPKRKPTIVYLDQDLFEWTGDKKRTDMVNRLLRVEMGKQLKSK